MPLKKELSLIEVTLCGVGLILGAGIYALIGAGAGYAGNAVWLSFALGAMIAGLSGLSYAELVSMYPNASAEYEYSRNAFGRKTAFIVGWLVIFASIVGATVVSIGFGGYFAGFFGMPWFYGALLIIGVSTAVLLVGVKQSAQVGAIITLIEAGGLAFIIFIGLPYLGSQNVVELPSISGVLTGAAVVFFAFLGFEEIARLSEETKNAISVIPKAIILSVVISTIFYILVAISAVSVIGWQALAESSAPLADVARAAAGNETFYILSVVALFSTANTVLLVMLAGSRFLYGLSKDDAIPNVFGTLSVKTSVPWIAVIATGILAAAFLPLGSIGFVASAVDFTLFATFILINLSLIKLRYSKPGFKRHFRVPLSIGKMPVLPVAGIALTLVLMANIEPGAFVIGLAVTAVGVVIALLFE